MLRIAFLLFGCRCACMCNASSDSPIRVTQKQCVYIPANTYVDLTQPVCICFESAYAFARVS
jgi:hypothetical protein